MITIQHIAKEIGVSKMTVSRVLSGQTKGLRRGSAERAEHIRSAAQRMGYRPNAAAMATSRGRFDNVTLVVGGTLKNPGYGWMPQSLMSGISVALQDHDLAMSLAHVSDEKLTDDQFIPRLLRHWATDGLLMNYIVQMPRYLTDLMVRYKIPAVWMNVKLETDCVYPDDVAAGRMATEHLLKMGHRRIGYVGPLVPGGHYSEADRLAGYRQVMGEAGLTPAECLYGQEGVDNNPLDNGRRWLEELGRPTAVVADKEGDATRLHMAGLSAGDGCRVSLITFNNEWSAQTLALPFTAVQIPFQKIGEQAVEMLVAKIKKPRQSRPAIIIRPEILEPGETCYVMKELSDCMRLTPQAILSDAGSVIGVL